MIFRILTLNIQNGQLWNETHPDAEVIDIDAVGRFLAEQDADILCLQEVERGYDGGMQVEPAPNFERLRALLPSYDAVFAYPRRNDTEIPFGLGLAIFSRTKLREFHRLDLPAAPLEFEFAGRMRRASDRLLIEAETTLGGRAVKILNTHLQAFFMIGSSSDQHPEQRNLVQKRLLAEKGAALLTGDMNCAPEEGVIAQFVQACFQPVQNEEITWRRRPYVVDHIFYNAPLRMVTQRVVPTDTSDHHALLADFEVSAE
jgi:endonuclease/exonuclease/phosphatase family metal-dependent hydrolase